MQFCKPWVASGAKYLSNSWFIGHRVSISLVHDPLLAAGVKLGAVPLWFSRVRVLTFPVMIGAKIYCAALVASVHPPVWSTARSRPACSGCTTRISLGNTWAGREKAQHERPSYRSNLKTFSCSAGLCPGLWGRPALFAGRTRHGILPRRLPNTRIRAEFFPIERL